MKITYRRSIAAVVLLSLSLILNGGYDAQADQPEPPPETEPFHKIPETGPQNSVTAPSAPTQIGGPDQYGYTWDDTLPMDWKDATGGTAIVSPGAYVDDHVYGPVSLPASIGEFQFYEWEYNQVYVSSNGLLGFDSSVAGIGASLENLPVPLDYVFPQNILAPFWDDLVIGGGYNSGGIYWDSGQDASGDFFVVEWSGVSRVFSSDLLTFEAVIYADGRILFQYQSLAGNLDSATVGIEDGDGVDGLQYLYNGTGQPVSSGKAIRFIRPNPGFRTKAFPLSQGGLNIEGLSTYQVQVRNTGDQGADTYNLTGRLIDPGWEISLFDHTGYQLLYDTSGDGLPDTGSIEPGETFSVTVKLEKPANASHGTHTAASLNVSSVRDPAEQLNVQMESSIPAPFAITFREGQLIYTELISEVGCLNVLEHDEYRGSSFLINSHPDAQYLGLWEQNELGTSYTNLYFTLMTSTGVNLFGEPRKLTDNQELEMDVRDYSPASASAANGNLGVVWVRSRMGMNPDFPATYLRINRNVYFAVLSRDGSSLILPPTNITNESGWYYSWDSNVPKFENASITASKDNYFHLAWVTKRVSASIAVSDIAYAVYRAENGAAIRAPGLLTSGLPIDNMDFLEPALLSYQDTFGTARVMVLYFLQKTSNPNLPIHQMVYLVRSSTGWPVVGQTRIHEGSGYGIDAVQLSDGRLALAWTDTAADSDKVAYILLNQNLTNPPPAAFLYNPDGRPGGIVSITRDSDGHAILTWNDSKWFQRLYYALIGVSGIINPPIVFKTSEMGGISGLQTSDGMGNAAYSPWFVSVLPWVARP